MFYICALKLQKSNLKYIKVIPKVTEKKPSECSSIAELRSEIDRLDKTIVGLLGERFGYVKEVVNYKERTAKGIEASDRRTSMMVDRRQWAQAEGLDPDVIESMFGQLVEYFIAEEKKQVLGIHNS